MENADWIDYLAFMVSSNSLNYCRWIEVAKTYKAELVARPFTSNELRDGLIADFLVAIDRPKELARERPRLNESAGNVAVAVSRTVMDRFAAKNISLSQRRRQLISTLLVEEDARRDDPPFQGFRRRELEHLATRYRGDNEYFASRVWPGRTWEEIFARDNADFGEPNEIDRKAAIAASASPFRSFLGPVWRSAIEIATDPKHADRDAAPVARKDLAGIGRHLWDDHLFPPRSGETEPAL